MLLIVLNRCYLPCCIIQAVQHSHLHYKKEIKRLEKAITARNSAFEAGDYTAIPELYNNANNSDLEQLEAFKQLLNAYVI